MRSRTGDTPETPGGSNRTDWKGEGSAELSPLHTHIHMHTSHKSRLSPVLMTKQLFSTGGSHNPSWALTNLLGVAHRTQRKKFYSLDRWFVTTGCNSGTRGWKRCMRQVWGRGLGVSCSLDTVLFPTYMRSPAQKLSNPFLWVLMKASLPRHGWLNYRGIDSTSRPPPQRSEGGAETQPSSLLVACIQPETLSKSPHWCNKTHLWSQCLRNSNDLGALLQKQYKDQICNFFL